MTHSRRPPAFAEDCDLASRTGPGRRDSDWGGHPRTHEEDLAWAAKRAAITMAAAALQARDGGTGAHCDDVVHLCDALADELGVYGHDRAELLAAGQLHDIGKVGPSQEVLDKPGPPDHHEWAQIREHTDRPYRGGRTAGAALEEVRRNTRSHQPNQPLSTGPGEFHSTSA